MFLVVLALGFKRFRVCIRFCLIPGFNYVLTPLFGVSGQGLIRLRAINGLGFRVYRV